MDHLVRAPRAYIAGFGTAGSLLAGAAMLFVLASAIVSFRGWPEVGSQPSSVPVIVTESGALTASAGASRVAAVVLAQARAGSGVLRGPGQANAHGSNARGPNGTLVTRSKPLISGGRLAAPLSGTAAITSAIPGTPFCTGSGCVAGPAAGGLGAAVQGALSHAVATTRSNLGSAVTGVAGSLAGGLTGVSSSLAGVVNNLGQTLNGTVTGTTGAAAGTLSSAGQLLGAILGQHQN